jgi:hypothetical protein
MESAGWPATMRSHMHIFMLGDSVFDNAAYVRAGEPDVRQQVAELLSGDAVSSSARDGAVVASIRTQFAELPADATHIVVSGRKRCAASLARPGAARLLDDGGA